MTRRLMSVLAAGALIGGVGVGVGVGGSVAAAAAGAQGTDSMSIARVITAPELGTARVGPIQWLPTTADQGAAYTTVEPAPEVAGAREIVRYDAATGARTVYVSAQQLVPPGGTAPLSIEGYSWSPDGTRMLLFTRSRRVWRDNTRGDYWVFDRRDGSLRQLGGPGAAPSSLLFAKFSPDGQRVAYVRDHELYVEPVGGDAAHVGAPIRLTHDGSPTVINGTSDWVYEEEFKARDCFRWSPDGSRIAYLQFDVSGVRDFLLIDDTDSLYSFATPVQYPKAGTTNSAVRAGVVSAAGGATTWLAVPGNPRDGYLPRLEWADNSSTLILQHFDRLQHTDDVMLADATTGAVHTVISERDSTWVDVVDDVQWVDGGRRFLWVSERDGWRHVYLVARDGGALRLLTPGPFDVISVVAVRPDAHGRMWLYFMASPDNATQRYLYRVRVDRHAAPERVTPATEPGTHTYAVSPDGEWAIHSYSTFDAPPVTDVVRLPDHTVSRTLEVNAALRAAAAPLLAARSQFFSVDIGGGVTMDSWMITPPDFDSTQRYPVLVFVYGGPAAQTVVDAWEGRIGLWHRWLAMHGYIVLSMDNRGTPAPKGRAWRHAIYGEDWSRAAAEQAAGVRAVARARPFIDTTRVAVWGHSGGGSNTLMALFRYPELYSVGMALAPLTDDRLYDTIYEERYMGLPDANAAGYRAASPVTYASGLRGSLLIVHGTGDDNVHFQGTEELINRLVALDKRFDLMIYPNRTHALSEGAGTSVHLYSLLTRYLLTHLPAGPRPAGVGAGARAGVGAGR